MKMTIQYDGSEYFGWQKQNDRKTVEGEILKAIKKLTGKDVVLSTAGRTDKGVHAYGQVTNFFVDDKFSADNIRRGINTYLKNESIQIVKVEEIYDFFHSRFSAKGKKYRYILNNDKLYFEINEDGSIVKANMTNKPITGTLEFSKIDISTSAPLPNTLIEIYNEND